MEEGKKQAYNRAKNRRLVLEYLRINHSAARALFVVSRLLNISTFIFTGNIVAMGEGVINAVESEFNKDPLIKVKTTISSIGKQGIVLGAIHHAMDDVLNEGGN